MTPVDAMSATASFDSNTPEDQELADEEVGRAIAPVASVAIRNSVASNGAERDPAHVADVLRPPRCASSEDDQEQRRHHQPVVDRLQQRALRPLGGVVQREDPERDEPELSHRRVAEDEPAFVCVNAWIEP